ncbi:MAG: tRNA preQ1(34) S-adenosylmethionine ribosyltransferase-isomerase QueA [Desulfomonilaceae bacterium]|nr:tRNA preQ1(34) S-adenosylmethionine ribosyltransferase-isomerase QueA [Desulfomonilaceae bacterium]
MRLRERAGSKVSPAGERPAAEYAEGLAARDNARSAEFTLSTYQYDLPPDLIAQQPVHTRDESRLLRLDRHTGTVDHHAFKDLPRLLRPSDLLVLNETRVAPCALTARKPTGGRVSLLVLDPANRGHPRDSNESASRVCIAGSSKPLRAGATVTVENGPEILIEKTLGQGRVLVRFPVGEEDEDGVLGFLEKYGTAPLPPYIRAGDNAESFHKERYQTVYSRISGSVAAPTAGLHFTRELLEELKKAGIRTARIVLHVGPGTFTPVREEDVRRHVMESEYYEISRESADVLQTAMEEGRRIIAVGTTTVRTLESALSAEGRIRPGRGKTDLFILPGHRFRAVQGLVTNFHLPGSTLLMLACAFAGTERVLNAYKIAVGGRYRFYSYGDACLML